MLTRNEAVLADPEQRQNDPHGEAWMVVIRPNDPAKLEQMMDASTYATKVAAA